MAHSPRGFRSPLRRPSSGATFARGLGLAALLVAVRVFAAAEPVLAPVAPIANDECLTCHDAVPHGPAPKAKAGEVPSFAAGQFGKSVHAKLNCVDCHAAIAETPHAEKLPPAQCASCHADAAKQYATSIHGASNLTGAVGAATCASCHGAHDIVPVKTLESPVFKLNLPHTCAKCHSNRELAEQFRLARPEAAGHYMESLHGRALLQMGLVVAPSCNDCHGVHDIKRSVDPRSPIHHRNIAGTCGKCHLGVEEQYKQSVHGQLLAKGDRRGPVCSDCHTAHDIERPANAHFKAVSDQSCGKCHQDRLEFYRETYHGKAMALGEPNKAADVAACYDCHGHHDVFPVSDPRSRLSKDRIAGTCQQCHPGVGAGFTQFQAHANPMDGENYPALHAVFVFMTTLVVGVFVFFGLHTLLWLVRSIQIFFVDSKRFHEIRLELNRDEEWFTRFTPFERFLHLMVVTSFLLLVITGMPLKFYYAEWAQTVFRLIGGASVARSLHHFGAIVTFAYFVLHALAVVANLWRGRQAVFDPATGKFSLKRLFGQVFGPDSMVPSWQDVRDFIAHNKWFFGKGPRPQFDRWTYWERFDYFAVFWGVFVIGMSGLVLWFPGFFTKFLPGSALNLALVIHSDEALLAAGFIFTFHFFNTHFRLEKFPMDTVIFSGRISKTEMLHERKRWWDRLQASGRIEQHRVKDDWEGRKPIARVSGYLFFGTGLVLLGLIVYAMTSHLLR